MDNVTNVTSTFNHCTSMDADVSIQVINYQQASRLAPVIVMMSVIFVCGCIGNSVVLLVYVPKKNKSTANVFMMLLAVVDFSSSILLHPYLIRKLFHLYGPNPITCKVFEFVNHTGLAVQGCLMLSIAIDRYYAICHPLKFENNFLRAKVLITASFVCGVCVSIPILFFYGKFSFILHHDNCAFVSHICHYSDQYEHSLSKMVFSIVLAVLLLSNFAIMVTVYILIGGIIYKRNKMNSKVYPNLSTRNSLLTVSGTVSEAVHKKSAIQNKRNQQNNGPETCLSSLPTNCPSTSTESKGAKASSSTSTDQTVPYMSASTRHFNESTVIGNLHNTRDIPVKTANDTAGMPTKELPHHHLRFSGFESGSARLPPKTTGTIQQKKKTVTFTHATPAFLKTLKSTKILFIVTAMFFMSWLPFWIIRFLESPDTVRSELPTKDKTEQVIEFLLNHMFYINNMVNPLIYTLNTNFREEVRKKWSKLANCLHMR